MPIGSFRLNTLSAAMAASGPSSITATGGTISYVSISGTYYKFHTFPTAGANSFVVSAVSGTPTLQAVLVGGGGASGGVQTGTSGVGGGGGAGQYTLLNSVTPTAQTYNLTIGAGGVGAAGVGGTGGSTIAFGTTVIGGAGGGRGGGGTATAGANGGAAGGGGAGAGGGSSAGTSTGTYGGGSSIDDGSGNYAGGGGGGSAQAGSNGANSPTTKYRGRGGNGTDITSWFGSTQYVAAGGNGGGSTGPATQPLGSGSYGSGANGSLTGGGSGNTGTDGAIIIRYPIINVTSVSYISQTNSTTTTLTFPTIQAGDIAIYLSRARNTTSTIPTLVTPSGFSNIASATGGTLGTRATAFYKVLNGSESSTSISCMTATGATNTTLLIYRPSSSVNQLTFSAASQQVTDAVPTNQTLTMSGLTGPFVGIAYYASSSTITTRGSTVTATRELSFGTGQNYVKTFEATTSAGSFANSTISQTDNGTNGLISFTMTIL